VRTLAWLERFSIPLLGLLLLLGSARIMATYTVFNHTIDEPAHIACGLEWLDKGRYTLEPQHPPLARVAAAIGPYLVGRRIVGRPGIYNEGAAILYRDNHYDRNLALARLGILPFFWLGTVVAFLWARRAAGKAGAVLAAFLFTFLPPVLAHAGLATTDMALAATVGAAFLAALVWLDRPVARNSLLFGACLAAAALSKLSALAFFPAACAAALAWYLAAVRPRPADLLRAFTGRLPAFCLVAFTAAFLVWAGYRFSFGRAPSLGIDVPAPEFFQGIQVVATHNQQGHPAYLLGRRSHTGWWYYYPIVLAVKTPLPLLLLLAAGIYLLYRGRGMPEVATGLALASAVGILVFSLFSRINIGVRHILPVYFGFVIVASWACVQLVRSWPRSRLANGTVTAMLLWMAVTSLLSHPDYLPYFNLLAGSEPERILVDSDLDWGQDMKRLGERLREVHAPEVTFNPFISAYLEAVHGFPPIRETNPQMPSPGWDAVSLTVLKTARLGLDDQYPELRLWPDLIQPAERVGKSTLLYYFPPGSIPAPQ